MTAIMSFGLFVFSVPTATFEQMQRRAEYRIARNARIGARDAAQFIGPGDETVSLSGTIFSEMGDIEAAMEDLRAIGTEGTALPLVCANGTVYGTYAMTGLDERYRGLWPDGAPRAIEFTLDLLRVDDAAASQRKGTGKA